MSLALADYQDKAREAVQAFWRNRVEASRRQQQQGKPDQGTRGSVTSGKNMDKFVELAADLVEANGLRDATMQVTSKVVTLPGFFRPSKEWDFVVTHRGRLIAALEMKSQVGSLGNNFNNRVEEAVGSGTDIYHAYRQGAFGADVPPPFIGWLMLLEDTDEATCPRRIPSMAFDPVAPFERPSYAERYQIMCRRLATDHWYSAASLILSEPPRDPQTGRETGQHSGDYRELDESTSLTRFVTEFAGHIAKAAAR